MEIPIRLNTIITMKTADITRFTSRLVDFTLQ